jgi:hypothetical protein
MKKGIGAKCTKFIVATYTANKWRGEFYASALLGKKKFKVA